MPTHCDRLWKNGSLGVLTPCPPAVGALRTRDEGQVGGKAGVTQRLLSQAGHAGLIPAARAVGRRGECGYRPPRAEAPLHAPDPVGGVLVHGPCAGRLKGRVAGPGLLFPVRSRGTPALLGAPGPHFQRW